MRATRFFMRSVNKRHPSLTPLPLVSLFTQAHYRPLKGQRSRSTTHRRQRLRLRPRRWRGAGRTERRRKRRGKQRRVLVSYQEPPPRRDGHIILVDGLKSGNDNTYPLFTALHTVMNDDEWDLSITVSVILPHVSNRPALHSYCIPLPLPRSSTRSMSAIQKKRNIQLKMQTLRWTSPRTCQGGHRSCRICRRM